MAEKLTEKTRVIMPVDIAGVPFDYDGLKKVLKDLKEERYYDTCDSALHLVQNTKESQLVRNVIFIRFHSMQ